MSTFPVQNAKDSSSRRQFTKVLVLAAIAVTNSCLTQHANADGPRPQAYHLRNAYTGKLLDLAIVQGNPNGAPVHGWDHNQQSNQKWYLEPAGGGRFRLRNVMLGKYLDLAIVQDNPDGAQVYGWEFNGQANQVWNIELTPNGNHRLRNVMLGKYLDMAIFQGNPNGAKVHGWRDNGQLNQEWQLTPTND